jgi:P pilus assembly chaperone PapD
LIKKQKNNFFKNKNSQKHFIIAKTNTLRDTSIDNKHQQRRFLIVEKFMNLHLKRTREIRIIVPFHLS